MKMMLLILFAAMTCSAQTAKVIPLDPADAAEAKHLSDARADLLKQQADFDLKIQHKYASKPMITVPVCASVCAGTGCTPPPIETYCGFSKEEYERRSHVYEPLGGWEYGIEYSEDFKFIVPAPYTPPRPTSQCSPSYNGIVPASTLTGTQPIAATN